MRRLTLIVSLTLMAFLVVACSGVRGNGDVIEESHDVSGFDEVRLTGFGTVIITQGESESLTISAESNIMPLLVSEVEGDTLVIGQKSNTSINPTRDIVFTLSVTDLSRIEVSGAGKIEIDSLETDSLAINFSGAGDVVIGDLTADSLDIEFSGAGQITIENGTVTEQSISMSGVGNYEARDFQSETAEISISGAGNATIAVSGELNGSISGAGNISYIGSPTVDISTSGLGRVSQE